MLTPGHSSFARLPDLAAARTGGKALKASDEFFAPKENLLKPGRGIFMEGKYTSRGKWMDGWETRRRRTPGHDWCLIRLGMRGIIRGVNVDTNHFLGNYPELCSLEATNDPKGPWTEILPQSPLKGGAENLLAILDDHPWTYVRLNIYPDGGVARVRVHGEVTPDWTKLSKSKRLIDLAAVHNGGWTIAASDMFFSHTENLLMPGKAKNMGDGWETKRRRGPGHDWVIIRLGASGTLEKIEVDTSHFKGNYPDRCSLEGCRAAGAGIENASWELLLPETKLRPNKRHVFKKEIRPHGALTYVRFNIYPDGGVSRLRLYGGLKGP